MVLVVISFWWSGPIYEITDRSEVYNGSDWVRTDLLPTRTVKEKRAILDFSRESHPKSVDRKSFLCMYTQNVYR